MPVLGPCPPLFQPHLLPLAPLIIQKSLDIICFLNSSKFRNHLDITCFFISSGYNMLHTDLPLPGMSSSLTSLQKTPTSPSMHPGVHSSTVPSVNPSKTTLGSEENVPYPVEKALLCSLAILSWNADCTTFQWGRFQQIFSHLWTSVASFLKGATNIFLTRLPGFKYVYKSLTTVKAQNLLNYSK